MGETLVLRESTNTPAAGEPTISGTVQVGQTLTASTSVIPDVDGITNVSFTYQWVSHDGTDDSDISGATSSTYTLVDADEGKTIKAHVSFTDDAGHEESLTSAATAAVAARPNTPAEGAPTISGTAQVDETLTADTSAISDSDGMSGAVFTYQWIFSEGAIDSDISGSTASTYTLVDADQGKTIKLQVSFTDDRGNDESVTSAATETVAARPNTPAEGVPTISGTAQVGQTLTASTSGITDSDGMNNATLAHQWVSNDGTDGSDISDATSATYTLVDADEGKTIKVGVSFTDDRGNDESVTSAATSTVAARPDTPADDHGNSIESATDLPLNTSIAGIINSADDDDFFRMQVSGSTFLVISQLGLNDTFAQRHRKMTLLKSDGTSIATNATHRTRLGAGSYYIKVFNTAHDGNTEGYSIHAKTVADHGGTTGTATTLTLLDPDEARTTPVWLRVNGDFHSASDVDMFKVVLGTATDVTVGIGTSTTLLVPSVGSVTPVKLELLNGGGTPVRPSVEDTALLFRRTYSLDAGTHYFRLSSYTDAFSNIYLIPYTIYAAAVAPEPPLKPGPTPQPPPANTSARGTPTISGTAQVGQTLTADTSEITDADGLTKASFIYQWVSSDDTTDTDINDATSSTYTLVDADVGKMVKVRVSFTDDRGNSETLVSVAVGPVTARPNSQAPVATIRPGTNPVTEGTAVSFTISLNRAAAAALSVGVSVNDAGGVLSGTAPTSVSFAAGDSSKTITLSTQNDNVIDTTSTVTASLASGSGYTLGTTTSASVSVTDDDAATWTVSAQPTGIDEGGSSTITVAVANSKTFAANQTVSLTVTGTASDSDYTLSSASLTLTAGASSITATVTTVDDAVVENDETVTVTASHGGQTIGSATVTISDNDITLSSDATLSALTLSGIDIGTFSSETTTYSASVEYGVSSTTVRATPNDDGASVTIADRNGITYGTRYPIPLSTGSNSVRVTVTAEDGVTTKVYRVTVTRASPPPTSADDHGDSVSTATALSLK